MQFETKFINFAQGLDLKTDDKQSPLGTFLNLENSIFDKNGLFQKRNGFGQITSLPDSNSTYITTFNQNLTSISSKINAFIPSNNTWVTKGNLQPVQLKTQTLIRSNTNQSQVDSVIANNLICTVYTDQNIASLGTATYRYTVVDAVTGQNIIAPTPIVGTGGGTVTGSPRVYTIGNWFIILFTNLISATSHLQYMAVNINNPKITTTPIDIASSYTFSTGLNYDGVVVAGSLYIAYGTTSGGTSVKVTALSSSLVLQGTFTASSETSTLLTIGADVSSPSPAIYIAYFNSAGPTNRIFAVNTSLAQIMAPLTVNTTAVSNLTAVGQNGAVDVYYEVLNNYSYDSGIPTHYVIRYNIPLATGTPSLGFNIARSIGLASKAFIIGGVEYFLASYQSPLQPSYFLMNGSSSLSGSPVVVAKLAYSNGGGYLTKGLPNVYLNGSSASIPYLYKDLITAVAKNTNTPAGTAPGGIYSQTGLNIVTFTLGTDEFSSAEIGSNLNLSGGFLWAYDGYLPVEQNFFLWPDSVEIQTATTGGNLIPQVYFYQAIYEWTDNQGNAHRSAPSVPVSIDLTSSGTSTNKNTVNVPTLRLTYKTANPVKITVYRWSTAQQNYYQITSISTPLLNDTTADSVAFVDTQADTAILGNALIYTTGGVVEDVNAPSCNIMTLWQTRLFLVDNEDRNLIWYSKQVIENTPVEMSDLFTIYVAPTVGASGSTGEITALGAMDDKLIIFKRDAINYISGTGPDNTGANNLFTDPIFVTSVVGCTNQQSIISTPTGLMFQSDKGIWILDRSLGTSYIGAKVQALTLGANVLSAVLVPGTNEVRFLMDTGISLMYDYYYQQWSSFTGIPAISSCIYDTLHTVLDQYGRVFQETPGEYLDGTNPVLLNFTTSWINLAGLIGFQRFYEFALVGTYLSPHLLDVQISYDYGAVQQQNLITPDNNTGVYGSDALYGQTSPYGGPGNLEQWKINTILQKCQAFQITIQEVYDSSLGVAAGGGFTLSGINCSVGLKRSMRPFKASNSVG